MTLLLSSAPPPIGDPIAQKRRQGFPPNGDPLEGTMTQPWRDYFSRLTDVVSQGPSRVFSATLPTQSASIGATDVTNGLAPAGLYRMSYYVRVTSPAAVTSSIQVTFDWTDLGTALSVPFTISSGNTIDTQDSGTWMFRSDSLSPIRYSTTYASNPAGDMEYDLLVILEAMQG